MPRWDPDAALRDMLAHAREARAQVEGSSRADLHANRTLQLALVRLLEIVGDAASRVPGETRARCPAIPWPQIVGVRNRLIHGYDAVDLKISEVVDAHS